MKEHKVDLSPCCRCFSALITNQTGTIGLSSAENKGKNSKTKQTKAERLDKASPPGLSLCSLFRVGTQRLTHDGPTNNDRVDPSWRMHHKVSSTCVHTVSPGHKLVGNLTCLARYKHFVSVAAPGCVLSSASMCLGNLAISSLVWTSMFFFDLASASFLQRAIRV